MVTAVTNGIFQFWLLAEVKPYLPHKDCFFFFFFIMSQLEYCNFLYVGIDQSSCSAAVVAKSSSSKENDRVTPFCPPSLADFKILLLDFEVFKGLVPTYQSLYICRLYLTTGKTQTLFVFYICIFCLLLSSLRNVPQFNWNACVYFWAPPFRTFLTFNDFIEEKI